MTMHLTQNKRGVSLKACAKGTWLSVVASEVVSAICSTVFVYVITDGDSALILVVAAAAGAVMCLPLVWWDQQRDGKEISVLGISPPPNLMVFDMPIRQAIDYLETTVTHTFDRSSLADRVAFKKLHELMCNGSLPVVGATETFGVRRRIYPERCCKLTPEEQVVPQNPSSPEGVRFCLVDFADKNWKQNWDGKSQPKILETYMDLRVRSSDVYRTWPRVHT